MIQVSECLLCGDASLAWAPGRISRFLAGRCGIGLQTPVRRAHCPRCGFLFYDQRLEEAEVAALYRNYRDEAYVRERVDVEPGYGAIHRNFLDHGDDSHQARIELLRQDLAGLAPGGCRVLDYGGESDGWLTRGAFPEARREVFDISDGSALPRRGSFDLVVCAHVLEHVSFPRPFLEEVSSFARPGGLLYLEVPGLPLPLDPRQPFEFMPISMHEHVSFFSGPALETLVRACGLEVVKVWIHGQDRTGKVLARRKP